MTGLPSLQRFTSRVYGGFDELSPFRRSGLEREDSPIAAASVSCGGLVGSLEFAHQEDQRESEQRKPANDAEAIHEGEKGTLAE